MDINSQPKKSSSRKRRSDKTKQATLELLARNAWWPFDRVDGRLLEQLNKQQSNQRRNEYENAPF